MRTDYTHITLTRAQRESLYRIYQREDTVAPSYREFRRRVIPCIGDACVMLQWCGMWLGIEPDGYTHS